MLINPEKSNEGNQQILDTFEILREIHFGLKCLHQNLLTETWMPPDLLIRICKFMDQVEVYRDNLIQSVFRPYDSGLTFTAPKVFLDELGYAMHAHGSFNNGNATRSQILAALGRMGNVNLGNTSRTFQQLLSRKEGYTKYLGLLTFSLNNRINDFY